MAKIDIIDEKLTKLKQIQNVIFEDGIESNLEGVLARVLEFYQGFIPYN